MYTVGKRFKWVVNVVMFRTNSLFLSIFELMSVIVNEVAKLISFRCVLRKGFA